MSLVQKVMFELGMTRRSEYRMCLILERMFDILLQNLCFVKKLAC